MPHDFRDAARRWGRSNLSIPVIRRDAGVRQQLRSGGGSGGGEADPSRGGGGVNHFGLRAVPTGIRWASWRWAKEVPRSGWDRLGAACACTRTAGAAGAAGAHRRRCAAGRGAQLELLGIEYFDAFLIHDPVEMGPVMGKGGAWKGCWRSKRRGSCERWGSACGPPEFHRQALRRGWWT